MQGDDYKDMDGVADPGETTACEVCGAEKRASNECPQCGSLHYASDRVYLSPKKYCSGCRKPIKKVFACKEEYDYSISCILLGPCNNCGSEYVTHILPPTPMQKIKGVLRGRIKIAAALFLLFCWSVSQVTSEIVEYAYYTKRLPVVSLLLESFFREPR